MDPILWKHPDYLSVRRDRGKHLPPDLAVACLPSHPPGVASFARPPASVGAPLPWYLVRRLPRTALGELGELNWASDGAVLLPGGFVAPQGEEAEDGPHLVRGAVREERRQRRLGVAAQDVPGCGEEAEGPVLYHSPLRHHAPVLARPRDVKDS